MPVVTPRSEDRRLLREMLETMRDLRPYGVVKAGQVYVAKRMLRTAGVPVPRPRVERE